MDKIKKGDIVGRNSYGKDILFIVERIFKKETGEKIAILKGLIIRIEADAPMEDLVVIEKERIENNVRSMENKLENRIRKCLDNPVECASHIFKKKFLGRSQGQEITGKILHLDGDKKYSDKSMRYYKKLGLDAIVRNIPENRQAYVVMDLLERYNPDILVITGHDGMIKNGTRI